MVLPKAVVAAYVATVLADVACSLLLYASVSGFHNNADWAPTIFWDGLVRFEYSVSDCVLLAAVRAFAITGLGYLAARVAFIDDQPLGSGHLKSDINGEDGENIERQPLTASAQTQEQDRYQAKQNADRRKNTVIAFIFILCTLCVVQTGIKCVSFHFTDETVQGILLSSTVLWINLELYLMKRIVTLATGDSGHYFPVLHPHRLYFDGKVGGHWCDLCRTRIKDGQAYRCNQCDFDLCVTCFKRKDKTTGEGVVRTDKGIKDEAMVSNWRQLRRTLGFAVKELPLLTLGILCMLATTGASLLLPNYQGSILNMVIARDKEGFWQDVRMYIILTVCSGFFGGIASLFFNIVGARLAMAVRNQLFSVIIVQDIAFFDGMQTGDLTSRLSSDVMAMVSPAQTLLSTLLNNIVLLFGGVVMCFYTSWTLTMLAFTTIGPIIYITKIYANWSQQINKEIWAALGDASAVAVQALTNIRTVRAFSTELREIENYTRATDIALAKSLRDAVAAAGTYALTNYLDLGTTVLLLWYGGLVVMQPNSELSIGKLITFQLYWAMINSAYTGLMSTLTSFTRAGGAAQRVMQLLDNHPDIDTNAGHIVQRAKGDLKLEGVRFHYLMRPDQEVLKGIDLEVKAGQVCALVGRSGGGKSTLVHMLLRYYDPRQGRILIDGRDLRELNLTHIHQSMGVVAQDTQLFMGTIEENIAYGLDNYSRDELYEAARMANCHDFIIGFEEGYRTRVGERGVRLSGGQKQRIAIARVFLRKPSLLFLDEATSALDAESEGQVQAAIDLLIKRGGCTVILVAHRLSTVVNADKIAVVDKGRIVEQGNHEELLRAGGIYSKLIAKQMAKLANTIPEEGASAAKADTIDQLLDATEAAARQEAYLKKREDEAAGSGTGAAAAKKEPVIAEEGEEEMNTMKFDREKREDVDPDDFD